jgi:DisA bacterial checkpoint controller nucleotide-binding
MFQTLLIRDFIEIIIYSSCIFAFCKWLQADKTKNILIYFFAYCTLALSAWLGQLPTLTPFLFTYAPIALLLFIVLHEKTLQRNLVALRTITPAHAVPEDWLDTIISSCLALINTNKTVTMVIEQKDSLDHFLTAPFIINADISKHVLDIFLFNKSYAEDKMVWIDTNGKIRGINVAWIAHKDNTEDALFYTLHSDAIVLTAHPISRTFSVISNGKETKQIAAHQTCALIKQQLRTKYCQPKGAYRENHSSEKSISR